MLQISFGCSLRSMPLLTAAAALGAASCREAPVAESVATKEAVGTSVSTVPDGIQLANSADGDWFRLTGEVTATMPNAFMLDYGTGTVLVEMRGWDWYQNGKALEESHEVLVAGVVARKAANESINAKAVLVEDLNTYFYASATENEKLRRKAALAAVSGGSANTSGVVTAIDGRQFTLRVPGGQLRVDTHRMRENPLDERGFQQIEVGERVYAYDDLDA